MPHCKSLKRLVYFESHIPGAEKLDEKLFSNGFSITSYNDLTDLGGEQCKFFRQKKLDKKNLIFFDYDKTCAVYFFYSHS